MTQTIYRPENQALLNLLKKYRAEAESKALNRPQSFICDVERGTWRLDIVQLRDLCAVLGTSLIELVQELETAINAKY